MGRLWKRKADQPDPQVRDADDARDFTPMMPAAGAMETSAMTEERNTVVSEPIPDTSSAAPDAAAPVGRRWLVSQENAADFTTIGEAIVAASDHDTILIEPGVYFEDLVIDKVLHLQGFNGPIAWDKAASELTGDNIGDHVASLPRILGTTEYAIRWKATGGSISSLCLFTDDPVEGALERQTCLLVEQGEVTLSNTLVNVAHSGFGSAIECRHATVTMAWCHIAGGTPTMWMLERCAITLLDSAFYSDGPLAGFMDSHLTETHIERCTFATGLSLHSGETVVVKDSELLDGCALGGSSMRVQSCRISGGIVSIISGAPVIESCVLHDAPIQVHHGGHVRLIDSDVSGMAYLSDLCGVTVGDSSANVVLESNVFHDCQGPAVVCYGGATLVARNNQFRDNNDLSVLAKSGSTAVLEHNRIQRSPKRPCIGVSDHGTVAYLTDNTIAENEGLGVLVTEGARAILTGNMIVNNAMGVLVNRGATANIYGNRVADNHEIGMSIFDDSRGTIADNVFQGNGQQSIAIDDVSQRNFDLETVIRRNQIE